MNVLLCLHTSSIRHNSIDTRHHVTINCTLSVIHRVVEQPAVLTYSKVIPCFSVCQLNEAPICWLDWETPTGILLLFWHWVHYLYSFNKSLRQFANPPLRICFRRLCFSFMSLPTASSKTSLLPLCACIYKWFQSYTYLTLPPQATFLCALFQDPRLIEEKTKFVINAWLTKEH